jgi:hypothetical protein
VAIQSGQASWAKQTFGHVAVDDERRARRVVEVAAAVAARPAGTVTQVFDGSAEREAAYRLLSNDAVTSASIDDAMFAATARECASHDLIYAAVDGSSLSLRDNRHIRDVGWVGAWAHRHVRGLHVVSALALDRNGSPVGVCAQTWWARTAPAKDPHDNFRPLDEKETRFLTQTIQAADDRLRAGASSSKVVYLLDRGFDAAPVVMLAAGERPCRFILRAVQNRRVATPEGSSPRYLRDVLRGAPIIGRYDVAVPQGENRRARTARVQVQVASVMLEIPVSKRRWTVVSLNAVLVRELDGPKNAALSWLLLTTESIATYNDVLDVIRGYSYRWRIEELHRVWKSGGCNVEDMQLRSREAILKWAIIHCAVAARAVRLARRARTEPDIPAIEEFSRSEIDALIALRGKKTTLSMGATPDLATVVRLVADAGGYTGKSSGGPPGPTVIKRGLERLAIAAEVLANAAAIATKRSDE